MYMYMLCMRMSGPRHALDHKARLGGVNGQVCREGWIAVRVCARVRVCVWPASSIGDMPPAARRGMARHMLLRLRGGGAAAAAAWLVGLLSPILSTSA